MKKQVKRMQLHRETLRQLEKPQLGQAAGGVTTATAVPTKCDPNSGCGTCVCDTIRFGCDTHPPCRP